MICRCKDCNKTIDFRNYRGSKLSDRKCSCGGSYQPLSWQSHDGVNPIFPDQTSERPFGPRPGAPYFTCLSNRNGDLFVYDKDHVIPFTLQLLNS
jgi:hypothetical protein